MWLVENFLFEMCSHPIRYIFFRQLTGSECEKGRIFLLLRSHQVDAVQQQKESGHYQRHALAPIDKGMVTCDTVSIGGGQTGKVRQWVAVGQ